jgi:hypothetical protein
VTIASNFRLIGVIIGINENLLEEYPKYKGKKQILNCHLDMNMEYFILNYDYRNCKLILNKICQSKYEY